MSAVQGFVLVFQMALLALALSAKLGTTPPPGTHVATPLPSAHLIGAAQARL
jgi:hypothetical protein